MGTIQTFGEWDAEIHEMPDQKKRLMSGRASKTTPASIDRKNKTGVFPGSGKSPYNTTLKSCTCVDFIRRKLPCKHMYRLAMDLGVLQETTIKGINKNLQIPLEEAVAELENLTDDLQRSIMPCLWNDGGALHIREAGGDFEALRTCRLVEIREINADAATILSGQYRAKDIQDICARHDIQAPERISKKRLIEWCIENAADCFIAFVMSDGFRSSRRDAYIYLKRKYDWEYFTGGKYPFGSQEGAMDLKISIGENGKVENEWHIDRKYYFPDDQITDLLTIYGHNRCLNGFDLLPNDVY